MRHIPDSFVMHFPLKQSFVALMVSRGYRATQANASGGWILMHPRRQLVLKVSDDMPTAQFAAFISGTAWRPDLPRVFAATGLTAPFTIIVMESLAPFPQVSQYDAWLHGEYFLNPTAPSSDPFGVAIGLSRLCTEARTHGVLLDVQGKNVLLRRGTNQLVFFDPFA